MARAISQNIHLLNAYVEVMVAYYKGGDEQGHEAMLKASSALRSLILDRMYTGTDLKQRPVTDACGIPDMDSL